jgi:hypothetical protein
MSSRWAQIQFFKLREGVKKWPLPFDTLRVCPEFIVGATANYLNPTKLVCFSSIKPSRTIPSLRGRAEASF